MIQQLDIVDAIIDLLEKQVPVLKKIYIDLAPLNCVRPCVCIETGERKITDAANRTVYIESEYTLTVYDAVDDYSQASTRDLLELQEQVMRLFYNGKLAVADRHLEIKASSGGRNWSRAFIELQLSYFDDRGEAPDDTPLMESVAANISTKE